MAAKKPTKAAAAAVTARSAELRSALSRRGLRPTRIRLTVYELLVAAGAPLAHAEIMARLPKQRGNRVTIYRALEGLIEHRLVHGVAFPDRIQRFAAGAADADRSTGTAHRDLGARIVDGAGDGEHGHGQGPGQGHAHFICTRCAATLCVGGSQSLLQQVRGWLPKPYAITGLDILVYGLCPNCRRAG